MIYSPERHAGILIQFHDGKEEAVAAVKRQLATYPKKHNVGLQTKKEKDHAEKVLKVLEDLR
jgi:hypothetical protein